jgi:hypothetical protein
LIEYPRFYRFVFIEIQVLSVREPGLEPPEHGLIMQTILAQGTQVIQMLLNIGQPLGCVWRTTLCGKYLPNATPDLNP